MKTLPLPPLSLLNKFFIISDESPSGLYWKNPPSNRIKAGSVVGHRTKRGYWNVSITTDKKRLYQTHRIVFFMKTGIDPHGYCVDHAKHDLTNYTDLRLATPSENSRNTNKAKHRNQRALSSKFKGVHWNKVKSKWTAQIKHAGKTKFLGYFVDEIEAAHAYDVAALDFYGEFACINNV